MIQRDAWREDGRGIHGRCRFGEGITLLLELKNSKEQSKTVGSMLA